MELWEEILYKAFHKRIKELTVDEEQLCEKVVNCAAYTMLKRIKEIIADDSLDDDECFTKIEEIVCLFEEIGSSGDGRHDF